MDKERDGFDRTIRSLSERLNDALAMKDPQTFGAESKIKNLQFIIKQRDGEIGFLKETVKIECEERMGLIATIAELQKEIETLRAGQPTSPQIKASGSRPLSRESGNNPSQRKDNETADASKAQIMKLFKNASIKNEKRLKNPLKQTRNVFL
jgi:hypothetical protein